MQLPLVGKASTYISSHKGFIPEHYKPKEFK